MHHGFGDTDTRHRLAFGGVVRGPRGPAVVREQPIHEFVSGGRVVHVTGDAAFGVAREVERLVGRCALRGAPDVAARFAVALHRRQRDHHPGPLVAGGGTAGTAPAAQTAGGQHGLLGAPLPSQSPDLPRGDTALALGPLRGLGHTVALAENVVFPLVETAGAFLDVVLVVEVLGEPGEGDAQPKGYVGPQARREPLVGIETGGVVEVGIDEHHLDAELFHPEAAGRTLERRVDAAPARLRVRGPEDDHVGVFQSILQQIVLLGDAEAVTITPHVRAAPVPAFPAIGVVLPIREADQVHEAEIRAVAIAHVAPQMVGPRSGEDRRGADLPFHADHLVADDVQGFVPRDGLVSRDTPVLDVTVALWVEIHTLERREDPLGRVDHGFLRHRVRRKRGPTPRLEFPPSSLDRPALRVVLVQVDGRHADDPAVLHVHEDRTARGAVCQSFDFCHACHTSVQRVAALAPCGMTGRWTSPPIPLYIRSPLSLAVSALIPLVPATAVLSGGMIFRAVDRSRVIGNIRKPPAG